MNINKNFSKRYKYAIIAFGGQPHFRWMKLLKRGFYHTMIILPDNHRYILIDPLAGCIDVMEIHVNNIENIMIERGYRVFHFWINDLNDSCFYPSILTCVGVVKRILGIRRYGILTPFQLFKYFLREIGK